MSDVICPFCKEGDFDLIGLKAHLEHDCFAYRQTPKPDRLFATEPAAIAQEGGGS